MSLEPDPMREACDALGLARDDGARIGPLRGVSVWMRALPFRAGDLIEVGARYARPVDLGLDVRLAPGLFVGAAHDTDDPEFDGLFSVRADPLERDAVRALLTHGLRSELCALAALADPALDDHAARCLVAATAPTAVLIDRARRCASLASLVDHGGASLTAPARLRRLGVAAAFAGWATRERLPHRMNALSAAGPLRAVHVDARLRANGPERARGYTLRVRFLEPLAVSLSVRRATVIDRARALVATHAHATGDARFDGEYRVSADDPVTVRAMLSDGVRDGLLAMARLGATARLDHEGMVVRGALPESLHTVPELLDRCVALRPLLRAPVGDAPYR